MLCISRSCCSVNNVSAQNLINSTNVHWKGKETRLSESQLSIIPIANISAHLWQQLQTAGPSEHDGQGGTTAQKNIFCRNWSKTCSIERPYISSPRFLDLPTALWLPYVGGKFLSLRWGKSSKVRTQTASRIGYFNGAETILHVSTRSNSD